MVKLGRLLQLLPSNKLLPSGGVLVYVGTLSTGLVCKDHNSVPFGCLPHVLVLKVHSSARHSEASVHR